MSELIFEKSSAGRRCTVLHQVNVPSYDIPQCFARSQKAELPEVAEVDLVRHYTNLSRDARGVDNLFYPLGSCTMKYNPKVNEDAASLRGFTGIHPLQSEDEISGCLELMHRLSGYLCEITGMDAVSLQPCAGAHGEFTGLAVIKAYLNSLGEEKRTKLIIPDSAHGTNPASASMNGFECVNIPSTADGFVDLDALRKAVGDDTAALMLTNPNTVGMFDKNILEIAEIVHGAGGLLYYDGANMNAVMGIARPGDMGFDVVHLNLHKTFSTPHGGGGPGSGPVGCKEKLAGFLPDPSVKKQGDNYAFVRGENSIGKVSAFYGNFLVMVRALCYIEILGAAGLREASMAAVLNANYMLERLNKIFKAPFKGPCMHEFVLSLEDIKAKYGISAADFAKGLIDNGIHPPTMYFPLIVHEALMFEPTETESREMLDRCISVLFELYSKLENEPETLHAAPVTMSISRPDEVQAARHPVLKFEKE